MAAVSKEEYLKKYLNENAEVKKKRKKKKAQAGLAKLPRSRIVDDDVDLMSLLPENLANTLDEDVGDNEPTVAEVIDERPEHVKQLEKYRLSTAWKVLGTENQKQQRHDSDSDQSPRRHDSDSDQSPRRRNRHDSDSDQSPRRRNRHDSDSDQSPPRRQMHHSDSDQSPRRRKRHDSDSDLSPPRKRQAKVGNSKTKSPPRGKKVNSDSDQSPPRKRKSSRSPRRRRQDSDSDLSPPRKGRRSDPRNSPARLKSSNDTSVSSKTLAGKKAGLSSAKAMRAEADELKRKEEQKFMEISDERLGRGATTVFRDKSGRKRNLQEERMKQSEEAKEKAKKDEQFQKWGKGMKQLDDHQKALADALHESDKPLARYKDDNDLDQMMRNMDRAEDPMLAFITKKKKSNTPQMPEKPKYKGRAPPPNRYNIMPGYRWDGVDRSNGFEKQIFSKEAEKRATTIQAYKWSIEDM